MLVRLRTPHLTKDRRSAFSSREGSRRRRRVNPESETRPKGRRIPKGSQAGQAQEECASSHPHHSRGAPTRTRLTSVREAIRWERCRRPLSLLRSVAFGKQICSMMSSKATMLRASPSFLTKKRTATNRTRLSRNRRKALGSARAAAPVSIARAASASPRLSAFRIRVVGSSHHPGSS